MKRLYILLSLMVGFLSCSKDDPAPDISELCSQGDMWLVDKIDSFHPNHSLDSFKFHQAGGFHIFSFTNSGVNNLYLEVYNKPDVGKTFYYKTNYIKQLSGLYINKPFILDSIQDSALTISHMGTYYLVNINPSKMKLSNGTKIELRACNLKMNDIIP